MFGITKHIGLASLLIIVTTFVLFALALFTVGLTHDLLLEAGVFLVSVKLILGSYRDSVFAGEMKIKLEALEVVVQRIESHLLADLGKAHQDVQQPEASNAQAEANIVQAEPALVRSL